MKRFTETLKWGDPWFRRLKPEHKLLWQWLLDNCDNAGVIEPDLELASFQVGFQYPLDTLSEFGERVLEIYGRKWFIPKFIEFQYGKLSEDCKPHKQVFQLLEKHGIEGYAKGIHTLNDKDKDQEKEKDQEQERPLCTIEEAVNQAPMCRMSEAAARFWWNDRNSRGWRKGGAGSPKIRSWQSDMSNAVSWAEEQAAKTPKQSEKSRGW